MTRPPARAAAPGRAHRYLAAVLAAVLALVAAVLVVTGPQAPPAAAAIGFCPDGDFPDIGPTPPLFTDRNVTVYAGGDYHATASAAESEGLLVVAGDAMIDHQGNFSVGSVGAGSQITPPDGAVMLAVGGGLEIADGASVTVGSTLPSGGAVNVGESVTGGGTLSTAGTTPGADAPVTEDMGAAAVAEWADFATTISDASAEIAGWPAVPGVLAGNRVTFTGSGTADPQVFTIDAAELSGLTEVVLAGIPDGAAVAIDVVGDGPVDFTPNYWEGNGTPSINGLATPGFGGWAARILWNFETVTDLSLGTADQFLGTILAPAADATIATSTNGRVLVGGNLTFGDPGVQGGLEMHSYPWIGPGPFDCVPSSSFGVQKTVTGEASADVPAGTTFDVDYAYEEPDGTTGSGTLTVPISGALVYGPDLPVGTVVTVSEPALPEVPGVEWGTPVIQVDGEPLGDPAQFTIEEDRTFTVTVVNIANAGGGDAVGGFTVQKAVTGDAAGAVPDDAVFLVDWEATIPDGTTYDGQTSGTLEVLADGTVTDGPADLPVGTTVTLIEQAPPEIDGVVWGTPTVDPASPITIVEGATGVAVILTNTATAPEEVGGFAVRKVVDGDASGAVPPGTTFGVAWTADVPDGSAYDGPTEGTVTILADGTVADGPQDLPVGTVVTFVEQQMPSVPGVDWGTPTVSPATVTIGEGDEVASVVVTNEATAQVGGFSVVKTVEGGVAGTVPPGTEFRVEWTATVPEGFAYDGDVTGTVTLLADGTAVDGPQDLPVGTVVTFTEVDLPDVDGVVWGAPTFSPASVTVGADESTLVTLTNTTQDVAAGGFSAAKEVTGARADLVPGDTVFVVAYSYELEGVLVGGYLDVPADGTVVDGPQNLPVGTVVTYTEADLPQIPGVTWGTPAFSPQSVTVGDGQSVLVTATNTANQEVGGFSVVKAVVGDAADAVPPSTVLTVAYAFEIGDETVVGELAVRADGEVVEGPQGLPVGTVVRLTEIDLPVVDGVAWGTPTFAVDGEPVTTVTVGGGDPVVVTLTNTATDDSDPLATTGDDSVLAVGLALLFVATGAAVLAVRAHRRREA